eukprot:1920379-Prymnesium_polylepis.1
MLTPRPPNDAKHGRGAWGCARPLPALSRACAAPPLRCLEMRRRGTCARAGGDAAARTTSAKHRGTGPRCCLRAHTPRTSRPPRPPRPPVPPQPRTPFTPFTPRTPPHACVRYALAVFYRKGRKRHGTHHSSEGRMKSQVVKQEILQEVAQTARCGKARSFADAARIAAKTHRDLNAVGAGAAANGAAAAKPWNFLLAGLSSTQQAVQHDARSPGRVDPCAALMLSNPRLRGGSQRRLECAACARERDCARARERERATVRARERERKRAAVRARARERDRAAVRTRERESGTARASRGARRKQGCAARCLALLKLVRATAARVAGIASGAGLCASEGYTTRRASTSRRWSTRPPTRDSNATLR